MEFIRLKNFKCFRDRTIHLNQLTVLAGSNNVGKSSVIQGLLMLHTSIHNKGFVDLNKSLGVQLGYDTSILNRFDNESDIEIEYGETENGINLFQKAQIGLDPQPFVQFEGVVSDVTLPLGYPEIYYLCVERIGPRLAMEDEVLKYRNVGIHGEHTGQILYENTRFKVEQERRVKGYTDTDLKSQTNAWLSIIMPGFNVGNVEHQGMLTQILVKTEGFEEVLYATNVGLGFSYLLPIIVTCLIAEKGRYVIIEYPEVHLHPSSQSALGQFLVKMANAGLHIVVETHSDHIVDGILLGVAANPEKADSVLINSFDSISEDNQPQVHEIKIDGNANLSVWPKGFMDQCQKDFIELTHLRNGIE